MCESLSHSRGLLDKESHASFMLATNLELERGTGVQPVVFCLEDRRLSARPTSQTWYTRKDSNLDLPLIGRRSYRWTTGIWYRVKESNHRN